MSVTFADLLSALRGVPDLPGAKCRGKYDLFDPARDDEDAPDAERRHRAALEVCAGCPALDACGAWLESLRTEDRPLGVIAGRIRRPKKPKKVSAA